MPSAKTRQAQCPRSRATLCVPRAAAGISVLSTCGGGGGGYGGSGLVDDCLSVQREAQGLVLAALESSERPGPGSTFQLRLLTVTRMRCEQWACILAGTSDCMRMLLWGVRMWAAPPRRAAPHVPTHIYQPARQRMCSDHSSPSAAARRAGSSPPGRHRRHPLPMRAHTHQ